MKKFISMLLVLVLGVFFAGYSEAGKIVSNSYDEASDETTVLYEVVKWDTLWNIYKEVVPQKISMEAVRRGIMVPNNISDETRLAIGKVLTIKFKGKNLNAGNFQNEKSSVVTETPKTGKVAETDNASVSIRGGASSVAAINHFDDYRNISDIAKLDEPIENVSGKESATNDLTNSLQTANLKIAELGEIITRRDGEILSLRKEIERIKAGTTEGIVKDKQAASNKYHEELALKMYYKKRALMITGSVFIILVLLIVFVYYWFSEREKKYNPNRDRKRRILAAASQVSLKV